MVNARLKVFEFGDAVRAGRPQLKLIRGQPRRGSEGPQWSWWLSCSSSAVTANYPEECR